jgi:TPR repeat protein
MKGVAKKHLVEDGESLWLQARNHHDKDTKKAFDLYNSAVEAGSVKALNSLGVCYITGFGVKKVDEKRAAEYFLQCASKGDPSAMLNLANAYAKGDGVAMDKKRAIDWYSKASGMANIDALFNYALCFLEGSGSDKNPTKACELLKKQWRKGVTRHSIIFVYVLGKGLE